MTHETACTFPEISFVSGDITQQAAAPYLSSGISRWGVAPEMLLHVRARGPTCPETSSLKGRHRRAVWSGMRQGRWRGDWAGQGSL